MEVLFLDWLENFTGCALPFVIHFKSQFSPNEIETKNIK